MRQIVVGTVQTNAGIQSVQVWFRFPIPAGRQAYYKNLQASFQPQAPGDYANADLAEINLFQTGAWIEKAGFQDIIDPTSALATIQTRLANLYAAAATTQGNVDTALLSRWGSAWDGTTWTMRSS